MLQQRPGGAPVLPVTRYGAALSVTKSWMHTVWKMKRKRCTQLFTCPPTVLAPLLDTPPAPPPETHLAHGPLPVL